MISVKSKPRGAICTVPGCEPWKALRWGAVVWCETCGNGRCDKHRNVATGLICCGVAAPAAHLCGGNDCEECGGTAHTGTCSCARTARSDSTPAPKNPNENHD